MGQCLMSNIDTCHDCAIKRLASVSGIRFLVLASLFVHHIRILLKGTDLNNLSRRFWLVAQRTCLILSIYDAGSLPKVFVKPLFHKCLTQFSFQMHFRSHSYCQRAQLPTGKQLLKGSNIFIRYDHLIHVERCLTLGSSYSGKQNTDICESK